MPYPLADWIGISDFWLFGGVIIDVVGFTISPPMEELPRTKHNEIYETVCASLRVKILKITITGITCTSSIPMFQQFSVVMSTNTVKAVAIFTQTPSKKGNASEPTG